MSLKVLFSREGFVAGVACEGLLLDVCSKMSLKLFFLREEFVADVACEDFWSCVGYCNVSNDVTKQSSAELTRLSTHCSESFVMKSKMDSFVEKPLALLHRFQKPCDPAVWKVMFVADHICVAGEAMQVNGM